jgi:hypothetical protein
MLLPAGSVAQKAFGIEDHLADFRGDVIASCGGLLNQALVEVLVNGAATTDAFFRGLGIELNAVSQCGGHSVARTHRFAAADGRPPPPVGFGIMSTLEKYIRTNYPEGLPLLRCCQRT